MDTAVLVLIPSMLLLVVVVHCVVPPVVTPTAWPSMIAQQPDAPQALR
jgi:hypothetical protein